MARKTRAQIADEELTQQIIEKASRRSEASKKGAMTRKIKEGANSPDVPTPEMKKNKRLYSSDSKVRSIPGEKSWFSHGDNVQLNADSIDTRYENIENMRESGYAKPDNPNTLENRNKSVQTKTFEPKGQSANKRAEELEAKTADYNKKNQNIENRIQKVTNSGKMYTAKPKGKRDAIRTALEVGHRLLNKYVDVDGVIEDIAKNKATTATGAATAGIAATAHHIKERQKEQQSDEEE